MEALKSSDSRTNRAQLASAQFPLKRLSVLPYTALVLLLNRAQTIQSVGQFLTFLVVRCHANCFLDAIKNRVTCVRDSVEELSRVNFEHCELVKVFPIRRAGSADWGHVTSPLGERNNSPPLADYCLYAYAHGCRIFYSM